MFTWDSFSVPSRDPAPAARAHRRAEPALSGFVVTIDRLFYAAAAAFAVSLLLLIFG